MASPHMSAVISQTDFKGLTLRGRGKVRDIYDLGDRLLIVATDRLSAFDVILPTPIPDKGRVLTQLSLYWFEKLSEVIPHHVISASNFTGDDLRPICKLELEGRAMLCRRTEPIAVECVVRGYISGCPAGRITRRLAAICGVPLPSGLHESDKLPEAIFTPSTKATSGHDENISFEQTVSLIGKPLAEKLRDVSLTIYSRASEEAATQGIIIADTKFEFGLLDGELIWIDEALTPDSSRFWPADEYVPGKAQPSFDKQYVRDYLERIGWNKQPPAPPLPADVVAATTGKYREGYRRITGHALD